MALWKLFPMVAPVPSSLLRLLVRGGVWLFGNGSGLAEVTEHAAYLSLLCSVALIPDGPTVPMALPSVGDAGELTVI